MRVATAGGGPGGLYFSLLLAKARPDAEIEVFEKNPRGATYGWGVVFSDRTLASFREADAPTYEQIVDAFALWDVIEVRYKEDTVRCGGQVFSGMARRRLLDILQRRCEELGVTLRFETEVGPEDLAGYDLVVAADGIHSRFRAASAGRVAPRVAEGRARYIWFGTTCPFDSFTFVFRPTHHGLFQAHVYPFDGSTSTFIVECDEATWRAAGLDSAAEEASIAFCEEVFARDLRGHSLLSNQSRWLSFPTLRTRRWWDGNVVFLGDAVHTAHFSIGSGTKLAMEDAIALAREVARKPDLTSAFGAYELERKGVVERFQQAARESQHYFESTGRYVDLDTEQFVFHLLTRSGRVGYDELRLKDAALIDRVDTWFARRAAGAPAARFAPPPAFAPLRLGTLDLPNRVVSVAGITDTAEEGLVDAAEAAATAAAAGEGAALVVVQDVAVSRDGRTTSGSPGLYDDAHVPAWRAVLGTIDAAVAVRLTHAGRRGSTRPRHAGTDRPLRDGWPLLAPAAIAFGSNREPRAITSEEMARVQGRFVAAADRASAAGFDVAIVDLARGYLLGSFLSPLSNPDGGAIEERARWPLEVFAAVRGAWAGPLGASLAVLDGARGGISFEDVLYVANALRESGCDFVEVTAGGAVPDAVVPYDPYTLPSYADRVRNEAAVPVVAGGAIATVGRVNTLVASGRADACAVMPRRSNAPEPPPGGTTSPTR